MIVRSFRLSDYASVTQLLNSVLSETCFEETISALAKQLTLDSELILVAEVQGEITGVIVGTVCNNKGYYYRIAVADEYQRRGIGRSMVQALRNRFAKRKVSQVAISLDAHNRPVLPLYRAMGIEIEQHVQQLLIVNE